MDFKRIVKITKSLSSEISIQNLLRKLRVIAMEDVLSTRGVLMVNEEGRMLVKAMNKKGEGFRQFSNMPYKDCGCLPVHTINRVLAEKKPLVDNDVKPGGYAQDADYFRQAGTKSLFCLPINGRGDTRALIYLENQDEKHVFDHDFVETMVFINSHIATSVENAQLYQNLEHEVERRTQELNESFQSLELALVTVENQKAVLEKKNKKIQERNKEVLEKSRILKKQNKAIREQKEEIEQQNEKLNESHQELEFALVTVRNQRNELDEKNKDITDSIRYAQRIQSAIYPGQQEMKGLFPESFVFFRPRDIVSGDFYWMEGLDHMYNGQAMRIHFAAAVDCTGHGVPGALLSIFGNNLLHECTQDAGQLPTPASVLNCLDKGISRMMGANGNKNTGDGMDVSMIAYMPQSQELVYAGAARPLIYYHKGKVEKIRGSRFSIGSSLIDEAKNFEDIHLKPSKGDCIYLTSDGFIDQFGGSERKKFKVGAFKKMISEIGHLPVLEQKKAITKNFYDWKGPHDQIDDVLVMGIRF